jgi:hypothetical protein
MAFTKTDYLKEVEFLTLYPNEEGDKTLLATAITTEGHRVLLYAPSVSTPMVEMNSRQEYEECYDARNIPIMKLSGMRTLKIENTAYLMKGRHNECETWYIKVVYLDGPQSKPTVKKEEVEKLFGCCIDG